MPVRGVPGWAVMARPGYFCRAQSLAGAPKLRRVLRVLMAWSLSAKCVPL